MSTTEQISAPLIRRLTIEGFRGIQKLVWYPQPGVNVLLGGGDVGKTTILDALALLFTPGNPPVLSDSDYWCRLVEQGFCIEAVMSLPSDIGINQQGKPAWPWQWDGAEPRLPDTEGDDPPTLSAGVEPVYRLQVRGTSDFEAVFELHQPDGTYDHLSVNTRRRIGMVRLSGDDRNDRDLRLVQGSALDRLIADKAIRSRIAQRIGEKGIDEELRPDAKQKLVALGTIFKANALPSDLALGLTGGQGFSLNALIGLTAKKDDVHLPLASWGAGTRRLAALQIAAEQQSACPITLVDEVERGLEPYRQRVLMKALQDSRSHVFVTTHSAVALAAASQSTIWYMDAKGAIGRLPDSIAAHYRSDPETFLARVAVIAEGKTEKGFVEELLRRAIEPSHLELGIWVTDAGGNDQAITFLEGCVGSGLQFAGFVADHADELDTPHRWAETAENLGRWILAARKLLKDGGQIDLRTGLPSMIMLMTAEDQSRRARGAYSVTPAERKPIDGQVNGLSGLLILSSENDTVQALRAFFNRRLPIWEGHVRDYLSRLLTTIKEANGNVGAIATAAMMFLQEMGIGFAPAAFGNPVVAEVTQGCTRRCRGKPALLQRLGSASSINRITEGLPPCWGS